MNEKTKVYVEANESVNTDNKNEMSKQGRLKFVYIIGAIFMFFLLFFPVSYNVPKIICLVIILFIVIIDMVSGKLKIRGKAIKWILLIIMSNAFFIMCGLINNAPGATRQITIDILWPVVFSLIGLRLRNTEEFKLLTKCIINIAIFLCLYDISYVFHVFGFSILPDTLYNLDLKLSYGNYSGYMEYSTTHMASLMFLVPFTISLLLIRNNKENFIGKKRVIFAFVLEAVCVIASGRSALILVTICAPVVLLCIRHFARKKSRSLISLKNLMWFLLVIMLAVLVTIVVTNKMKWNINVIMENILSGFNFSDANISSSQSIRGQQFKSLMNGWLESPLIGHGAGSYSKEISRSFEQVWSYELSYCALLFQKGIIGFAVFWCFIIWIIKSIIKKVKVGAYSEKLALPYIIGLVCFLIANASNPYLNKFGYMWVVYIPFALAQIKIDKSCK